VELLVSLQFENSQTALHVVAMNGFVDMFQLLLPHFRSVLNQKDSDGRTPVFLAAKKGNSNQIR
jgi:ankyrin repeat protein